MARRWSQAELAAQLGISQPMLSHREAGRTSFTAEELLRLMALFNVGPDAFVPPSLEVDGALMNALARYGAAHLLEREQVPTGAHGSAERAIFDALVDGSPRLVTATAPVLVRHVDKLHLARLHAELAAIGRGRRLCWMSDCTYAALDGLAGHGPNAPSWRRTARRVGATLRLFLDAVTVEPHAPWDPLDPSLRSSRGVERAAGAASTQAARWRVATAITVGDFRDALEAAGVPG